MYAKDANVLVHQIRKSKLKLTPAERIFIEKIEKVITLPLGWIDQQSSRILQKIHRKSIGFSDRGTKIEVLRNRPIIFSGPMIKAILESNKTMTRRVVKPQPPANCNVPLFDSDGVGCFMDNPDNDGDCD